jgi:hypothetical protein
MLVITLLSVRRPKIAESVILAPCENFGLPHMRTSPPGKQQRSDKSTTGIS